MTRPGGWTPDQDTVEHANLTRFMAWLAETGRGEFADYHELLRRSVNDIGWFWNAVWHFFDIRATTLADTVVSGPEMPGAQWFPGATLNYVSEVFRHETEDRPALIVAGEDGSTEWSWERLRRETASFAHYLRRLGVKPGDRVVGYLPSVGEALAAFLGTASVGATWAVCNQDLAVAGDCLVIGIEQDDGGYWMPLFVHLGDDVTLDEELRQRIVAAIRTGASPRHVPDDILEVPGIPRTMTGKRLEIPIKRILLGAKPADVVSPTAVDRPDLLDAFAERARR